MQVMFRFTSPEATFCGDKPLVVAHARRARCKVHTILAGSGDPTVVSTPHGYFPESLVLPPMGHGSVWTESVLARSISQCRWTLGGTKVRQVSGCSQLTVLLARKRHTSSIPQSDGRKPKASNTSTCLP